jgi:prepilin-type N-terminal cleavage/methylation domain-containing protein
MMRNKKGFSLVEVLVAVFIATLSIFIVWKVYTFFIEISFSNPSVFQASFLAEEGIEAMKLMRDDNWTANIAGLTSGVPYTLTFNGTAWALIETTVLIDSQFDRRVLVYDVYRDGTGNIAESGTLDRNTKKISVQVSWVKNSKVTSRQLTTYVSNIFEN